jgi:hypothetical protein
LYRYMTGAASEEEAMAYALGGGGGGGGQFSASGGGGEPEGDRRGVMGVIVLPSDLSPASRDVAGLYMLKSSPPIAWKCLVWFSTLLSL